MTIKQRRDLSVGIVSFVIALVFGWTITIWAQNEVWYFNSVPYYFPSTQGDTGTLLTNDGSGHLTWSPAPTPEGIWTGGALLSTVACPAGWTKDAGGYYLVAAPNSGTVGGTVGTALTNLENRAHTHTGPSHQHTGPEHGHSWAGGSTASNSDNTVVGVGSPGESTTFVAAASHTHGPGSLNIGLSGTGATGAGGTGATGSASTMIAPYKQLNLCVKD